MTIGDFGTVPGVDLFGVCIGLRGMGRCGGLDGTFYLFPGLAFGLAFAGVFLLTRRCRVSGAVAFCVGTLVAHALAITATLTALNFVAGVGPGRTPFAISGLVGGALGGGTLAWVARRLLTLAGWLRLAAMGSALGLLLPLVDWDVGLLAFYALWQAGYAGTLAAALPRRDVMSAAP